MGVTEGIVAYLVIEFVFWAFEHKKIMVYIMGENTVSNFEVMQ